MPYTMEFTSDGKGLLRKGWGVVKGQEIIDSNLELLTDEKRLAGLAYARADFSGAAQVEIASEDIHRMVESNTLMARINPSVVVVVIAPRDAMFGMARMWETLADSIGWKTKVVRTAPEADAWLETELALDR